MLRPFDVTNSELVTELPQELNDILVEHKIAEPVKSTKLTDARDVFNAKYASIDEAAQAISSIMKNGEKDTDRLKAADMVLKVHGILNELDEKQIPVFNITVNNMGTENKTLVNLVLPVTG